jgi:hypothetical protein
MEEMMAKLTDGQLVVLAKASARDDEAAVLPARLPKPAAMKIGRGLVSRKLMREMRSKPDMPVWREEDGRKISLILTRAGREAIGVKDARGTVEPRTVASVKSRGVRTPHESSHTGPCVTPAASPLRASLANGAPRSGSKLSGVIVLLERDAGVAIGEIVEATGWLPHTVRAALTGLRKRGFDVERSREKGNESRYRIAGHSSSPAS